MVAIPGLPTSSWVTFDANDIPFVQQALALLEQLQPYLETAENAAETAATILGLISDVLGVLNDPTEVIKAAITALINGLLNNNLNLLVIEPTPITRNNELGMEGFARILRNSFADLGDFKRPEFEPGEISTGVVILASAPSFTEIADIAETLQLLFGDRWQEIIDLVRSLPGNPVPHMRIETTGTVTSLVEGVSSKAAFIDSDQVIDTDLDPYVGQRLTMFSGDNAGQFTRIESFDPRTGRYNFNPTWKRDVRVGDTYIITYTRASEPPNWEIVRAVDVIPPLAQVAKFLANVRDSIGPLGQPFTAIDILQKIVDLLQRKAILFERLLQQVQELVTLLTNLGELTNINLLRVAPQEYGNEGFISAVYQADNRPALADDAHVFGLAIYGGSSIAGLLNLLFPIT